MEVSHITLIHTTAIIKTVIINDVTVSNPFFTFLYPVTGAFPMSGEDPSILGPDMSVNIECLLEKIPERKCDTERKQVRSQFAADLSYVLFPNVLIFTSCS